MSRRNKYVKDDNVQYVDYDGHVMSENEVNEYLMMYGKYPTKVGRTLSIYNVGDEPIRLDCKLESDDVINPNKFILHIRKSLVK